MGFEPVWVSFKLITFWNRKIFQNYMLELFEKLFFSFKKETDFLTGKITLKPPVLSTKVSPLVNLLNLMERTSETITLFKSYPNQTLNPHNAVKGLTMNQRWYHRSYVVKEHKLSVIGELKKVMVEFGKIVVSKDINPHNDQEELYTFCTPDKKKLRVLLKKELKNSDVGTPGRIVLPKREAEKNLPSLSSKEGIPIVIKDVYSNQEWEMRYRFWSNNKGRMYVLDNLGKFVEKNGLESGDYITFYEDESKNLYFSVSKAQKVAAKPTNNLKSASISCISGSFSKEALDEEDLSLQILIKEFEHREGSNSLMTSYMDDASSFGNCEQVKAIEPCSSLNSARMEVDDHQAELDNCFANLGTLLNLSN